MKNSIENWVESHVGRISGVETEQIYPADTFTDMAAGVANIQGTVALMSGGSSDSARFHMLAAKPWLMVKAYGRQIEFSAGNKSKIFSADPFEVLQRLLDYFALSKIDTRLPVLSGLFGYLAYDLKDYIENLPRTAVNDLYLPHMCLYLPSVVIIQDRENQITWRCTPCLDRMSDDFHGAWAPRWDAGAHVPKSKKNHTYRSSGQLQPEIAKPVYLAAVEAIKEYIVSGHIYQANFAQRFQTDFTGSPFALFKALFASAPAPFYAYVQAGDHQIVSTSPERFVRQCGKTVETRPIKGTRPRGSSESGDQAMREALCESIKDDAELSMIVDLLRNDFGRVCAADSVYVAEHKRVEAYVNVFHLVSIIKGQLREEMGSVDLIRATFPGGSITGCPRIRAMEVIDELEPVQRHIYTGSIGYISFHDTMDLSIAIRTATICGEKLLFSVGGGIVFDSDAEDEYQETLHKGQSLIKALSTDNKNRPAENYLWHNGQLTPQSAAGVPISDMGLQYGFGFFETIRVADGTPEFLSAHIERFYRAWTHLFETPVPDVTWADIISQVIQKNGLAKTTAAVKLIATRGSREEPPYDHQLVVTARSYTPRPALSKNGGLLLATYPQPRQTPLADFKTLNYLYYCLAGQWAKKKAADEALIINPDGSASETNTANILMIKGNIVFSPASPHVLPGVMEKQVLDCLRGIGFSINRRRLMPTEFFSADMVILTNSLMGAVPVISLDGTALHFDPALCQRICQQVLTGDSN